MNTIQKITTAIFLGALVLQSLGCHTYKQVCQDQRMSQEERRQLGRVWASLKKQKDKRLLQTGVNYILDMTLQHGRYKLARRAHTFALIDNGAEDASCHPKNNPPHGFAKDTAFLKTMYQIVQTHGLNINPYLPKRQQTSHPGFTDCKVKHALVEWSYWKAISGPHTSYKWNESCELGRQMLSWKGCLSSHQKRIVQRRIQRLCGR